MKIARLFLLFVTAFVFVVVALMFQHPIKDTFNEQFNEVAQSIPIAGQSADPIPVAIQLPDVGQTFPVAGQDEAEPDGAGIVLRAPDDCEVGELVRFDAADSDVTGLTWQILPSTPDFEIIEDGRRAFFSARAESAGQSFLVIVAGAKDGKPFLTHHTIDVIGVAPDPGPETLSTVVRRWVRNVDDYEGRKAHGLALSGVFRKLASADDIAVDQILEATATANSAVLGDHLDDWIPFLEPLGKELDKLTAEGKLSTRADYKAAWTAIADGIEKGI